MALSLRAFGTFLVVLAGAICCTSSARAGPPEWSSPSARTIAAQRAELGLFSASRWAPVRGVELGLHPVLLIAYPKLTLKVQHDDGSSNSDGWLFATEHGVAYPTRALSLLSGEGSLALLPDDAEVPVAIQLENDLLVSRIWNDFVVTFRAGLVATPREESNLPLLDFPFLYQRFAAVSGPLLCRFGGAWDQRVVGPLVVRADTLFSLFPLDSGHPIDMAWAWESGAQLGLDLNDRHRIALLARVSVARYPIGTRMHWFPALDYRFKLGD